MKKIIFPLIFFGFCLGSLQAQLNDYKYVIVPKKFDAFKKENQYLTSTLVKHLFAEKGYNAIYDDALPEELLNNSCSAVTAQVIDESTMFLTKATIQLLDCQAKVVFTTQQGTSKTKDYKLSYGEALRTAFRSFDEISYSYSPSAKPEDKTVTVSFKEDIKQLPEQKAVLKEQADVVSDEVVVKEVSESATGLEAAVPQEAGEPKQAIEAPENISQVVKESAGEAASVNVVESNPQVSDVWYAQPIPNGFQLVDSSPKVRLKMYKTSLAKVFLSENEKGNGLVYEKNGQWVLEYYEGAELKWEKLNIKF